MADTALSHRRSGLVKGTWLVYAVDEVSGHETLVGKARRFSVPQVGWRWAPYVLRPGTAVWVQLHTTTSLPRARAAIASWRDARATAL